ncbi:MAG TPA: hypothetical protein VK358_12130, partial [Longimicrobium sp.]|nr:hypothetical protein [Longimicrobium sp.]
MAERRATGACYFLISDGTLDLRSWLLMQAMPLRLVNINPIKPGAAIPLLIRRYHEVTGAGKSNHPPGSCIDCWIRPFPSIPADDRTMTNAAEPVANAACAPKRAAHLLCAALALAGAPL